jgi:hypothetical protein
MEKLSLDVVVGELPPDHGENPRRPHSNHATYTTAFQTSDFEIANIYISIAPQSMNSSVAGIHGSTAVKSDTCYQTTSSDHIHRLCHIPKLSGEVLIGDIGHEHGGAQAGRSGNEQSPNATIRTKADLTITNICISDTSFSRDCVETRIEGATPVGSDTSLDHAPSDRETGKSNTGQSCNATTLQKVHITKNDTCISTTSLSRDCSQIAIEGPAPVGAETCPQAASTDHIHWLSDVQTPILEVVPGDRGHERGDSIDQASDITTINNLAVDMMITSSSTTTAPSSDCSQDCRCMDCSQDSSSMDCSQDSSSMDCSQDSSSMDCSQDSSSMDCSEDSSSMVCSQIAIEGPAPVGAETCPQAASSDHIHWLSHVQTASLEVVPDDRGHERGDSIDQVSDTTTINNVDMMITSSSTTTAPSSDCSQDCRCMDCSQDTSSMDCSQDSSHDYRGDHPVDTRLQSASKCPVSNYEQVQHSHPVDISQHEGQDKSCPLITTRTETGAEERTLSLCGIEEPPRPSILTPLGYDSMILPCTEFSFRCGLPSRAYPLGAREYGLESKTKDHDGAESTDSPPLGTREHGLQLKTKDHDFAESRDADQSVLAMGEDELVGDTAICETSAVQNEEDAKIAEDGRPPNPSR